MTNEVFYHELGYGDSQGCFHAVEWERGHITLRHQTWGMKVQLLPVLGFVCHLLLNKLKGPILFLFFVKLMQKVEEH